ncbi:helix-turn-helix transcriptional regulator [Phenylobacterium kunshanense]|uniref:HTH luxR-type domain-containing protein n=1 Tax=Phenylobacterium kunshanense TaxID=1445034 RepID=A0A328B896_9CAUL|nr:LuxR C-terminal-related transcriptional regulator [Phenylobacterium kunshanense]RAK63363.1 hypothetical protein DJ019_16700 [Phenylobacterium kunshanense]
MSDDPHIHRRLLEQAQAYARLYPSIAARLKAALAAGDPNLKNLVDALTEAMARADAGRERQLRDGWSLSRQEARVALHLIDGGTVATCAAEFSVAESTIRTHLKAIFAKTGRNRQAQLGSLLKNNSEMSSFD